MDNNEFLSVEWAVGEKQSHYPYSPDRIPITTKGNYIQLNKNGSEKKNAKPEKVNTGTWCATKEFAERIVCLHNTQLRQDSDAIRELIDIYCDGAKEKLYQILNATEQTVEGKIE